MHCLTLCAFVCCFMFVYCLLCLYIVLCLYILFVYVFVCFVFCFVFGLFFAFSFPTWKNVYYVPYMYGTPRKRDASSQGVIPNKEFHHKYL